MSDDTGFLNALTQSDPLAARAITTVLGHEGGLEDNPADPGGLTNFGFALRDNQDLTPQALRAMTRDQAAQRYYTKWWQPARWGEMAGQPDVTVKAFDAAVNMGVPQAVRCLQRACRACGNAIPDDGALGPGTVAAVNAAPAIPLLAALRSELAGIYRLIAEIRPDSGRFLQDWLARAYS